MRTELNTSGDTAGNLGATPQWKLPLNDDKRSSIIRRYDKTTGIPHDGLTADGWQLATKKDFLITLRIAYYGHYSDNGTPGYRDRDPLPVKLSDNGTSGHREGDPLPVKLSVFRPRREKSTGNAIISWTTEYELNNAGFNIKRSYTRNGEFEVINPEMIPGAGTTSERQSYIFTDITTKPNVVYYYQIECVSVDGTRRTLSTTHLRMSPPIDYILRQNLNR